MVEPNEQQRMRPGEVLRFDTPAAGSRLRHTRRHPPPRALHDPLLIAAVHRIERDLCAPPTLAELAAPAGLSPFQFHRRFAEAMGETVGGYLRRTRLEAGAIYLNADSATALSVAVTIGYGSAEAFTRAFERHFGLTPMRFRAFARAAIREPSDADFLRARDVRVETRREARLLGMRFYGSYAGVEGYWQTFAEALAAAGIGSEAVQAVGILRDNPEITPDGLIRYDCAILCPGLDDRAIPAPLARYRLHGGRYATLRHDAPYAEIFGAYRVLASCWLPASGDYIGEGHAYDWFHCRPWMRTGQPMPMTAMVPLR